MSSNTPAALRSPKDASSEQTRVFKDFRRIPGVGPATAADLWRLGHRSVAELADLDPETMYQALCALHGGHVDRCCLYVFRCAVYFAAREVAQAAPDPELLKWWNWKDKAVARRRPQG